MAKKVFQKQPRKRSRTVTLKELDKGVLVYAVRRRYKGKGPKVVILHKAHLLEGSSFGYGDGAHRVVKLGGRRAKSRN